MYTVHVLHRLYFCLVSRKPTSLTAVISESNSAHVNITVSWKSPGDPVTGYVIYYQSKGGPVISDRVSGGETALDGLQRGTTYNISIVALSPHLPSPVVGPHIIQSKSLPLYIVRCHFLFLLTVTEEPTNLATYNIDWYNSTHVNVTVFWEPAADNSTTGYVIHYKTKETLPMKAPVHDGEAKLDLLERGIPYIISIEALSHNKRNLTVGPYTFFGE